MSPDSALPLGRTSQAAKLARNPAGNKRGRKPKSREVSSVGVELWPSAGAAEAFQLAGRDILRQMAGSVRGIRLSKPEALHEMRVSLRRLDAVLRIFPDVLAAGQVKHVLGELKWIGRNLSFARDVDVFMADFLTPLRAKRPADSHLAALYRRCLARQKAEYRRAQAVLASERFRRFHLKTSEAIDNTVAKTTPDRQARKVAAESLALIRGKMKDGKRLKRLGDHDLHKFRLRVKRMRYALEVVRGLCGGEREYKHLDKALAALCRMQSALGDIADVAARREVFERVMGRSGISGPSAKPRIAGLKLKNRRRVRECLKQCVDAYDRLARTRPFWVEWRG